MPEIDTYHAKLHIAYIYSSNNERNQYISQKYSYGKKRQASFSFCVQTNVEVLFFKLHKSCNEIAKEASKRNVEIDVLVRISRLFTFINNYFKIRSQIDSLMRGKK